MLFPYVSVYITSWLYVYTCDANGDCNVMLISAYLLLAVVIYWDVGVLASVLTITIAIILASDL